MPNDSTNGQSSNPSLKRQKSLSMSRSRKKTAPSTLLPEEPVESTDQAAPSAHFDTYLCPICGQDLTLVRSSLLRQRHVEQCLDQPHEPVQTSESVPGELEFEYCVFCGKDIARLSDTIRTSHVNQCLDELAREEEENRKREKTELREKQLTSFAGQDIPFLKELEICPCCHEIEPFVRQPTLKQKVTHIKQCARSRNISMPQLIRKFQWIQWGHQPLSGSSTTASIAHAPAPVPPTIPIKMAATSLVDDDMEDDFSTSVVIHRTAQTVIKPSRKQDLLDDELQLALGMSRSMHEKAFPSSTKKKDRFRNANRNIADILSIDDSRQLVMQELQTLILPSAIAARDLTDPNPPPLPSQLPSKMASTCTGTHPSLWRLAAGRYRDAMEANDTVFTCHFMKHLSRQVP
ncbi:uncharacterized protein BYT42DRAFT_556664 [Radiomyces spectabilis]|uniref:uncharacterized protein n=1 Tax=Radiomyces spectabilis TaxID=64574 RepID=UPI00222071CB|nr:uncharacterized protein BYT42DRAFT_556664 [Radiomyces spectabilis]KAI8391376.1 hypothetical protein BYT42DRAFT_556664 [Radiomyces spectabilis]